MIPQRDTCSACARARDVGYGCVHHATFYYGSSGTFLPVKGC